MKPGGWTFCLSESNICRLGKLLHRLPNIGLKAITDVGLDEASPTYRYLSESNICRLGKQPYRLPNIGLKAITDVGLDETSPTYRLAKCRKIVRFVRVQATQSRPVKYFSVNSASRDPAAA